MTSPALVFPLDTAGLRPAEAGGLFDLVIGLPVHPLIVHLAVVVLPIAAIALVVIMALPKVHTLLRWGVIAALAVGALAAWVAKESGEALAERVGEPEVHAELGDTLPVIAGITLALGVIWAVVSELAARAALRDTSSGAPASRPLLWLRIAVSVITAGIAAYAVYFTVVVGHSGAVATWLPRVGG